MVNFFGWMSQGGHSDPLLQFALFYQNTPSCGDCPFDFSVSPSLFGLDFGTLDFGTSDSGLTISQNKPLRLNIAKTVEVEYCKELTTMVKYTDQN